jgi:hypothetical protein
MNLVPLFLQGAHVVRAALADDAVAEQWDAPSALEEQTVGSLASHLARGGVWVVEEYLPNGVGEGRFTYTSAVAYYAGFADRAGPEDHAAIRARGASIAADGRDAVLERLDAALVSLSGRLSDMEPERPIAVIAGAVVPLGEYLATRIVEQVVHLDDLERSIGRQLPAAPDEARALAVRVAADIGIARFGATAMVRALYRGDTACLPVF